MHVGELRREGSGWESRGWTDGTWFVKVWRDSPPANLAVLRDLDLEVPVPIARRTVDGALYATTTTGRPYGVFEFFDGRLSTKTDWREVARVLRLVHDHKLVELPQATLEEPAIAQLRDRLDHPWIVERRSEVERYLERLETVIDGATRQPWRRVLLHTDFGGWNLLVGSDGSATAILDWDGACIGPREHDIWIAFEYDDPKEFLGAYGAEDLDAVHLEFALLRRAVQDLTARVVAEEDREGVDEWGFKRWRRLDTDLALAKPFLAD